MAGNTLHKKAVGILALQGDVDAHAKKLSDFDIIPVLVKKPEQLKNIDGLIIPGGESTALLKLAQPLGILEAIKKFYEQGGSILGTCAGAILLANKVTNPSQQSLGLIDIDIERNGYGRQLQSTETFGQAISPFTNSLPMTFIRAPKIKTVGKEVVVLATYNDEAVLVKSNRILLATFHPELTDDNSVYAYWLTNI